LIFYLISYYVSFFLDFFFGDDEHKFYTVVYMFFILFYIVAIF